MATQINLSTRELWNGTDAEAQTNVVPPTKGNTFFAEDTGIEYTGDGINWIPARQTIAGALAVAEQQTQALQEVYDQLMQWTAPESGSINTGNMSLYSTWAIHIIGIATDTITIRQFLDPALSITGLVVPVMRISAGTLHNGPISVTGTFIAAAGTTNAELTYAPFYGLEITKSGTVDAVDVRVYGKP